MICLHCGKDFDIADRLSPEATDGAAYFVRYCSDACQIGASNRRQYQAHRAERLPQMYAKRGGECPHGCGYQTHLARHIRRKHTGHSGA